LQYILRDSKSFREIDSLGFPFIDLYVPALTPLLHCSEAALQFAENTTFMLLCRVYTGIVREQGRMSSRSHGRRRLCVDCTVVGQRWSLETPADIYLGIENSPSESELLYDWRFTANQFVLASRPLRLTTRDSFFNRTLAVIVLTYILSDSLTRRWLCLL
jgi:hypothetical protein